MPLMTLDQIRQLPGTVWERDGKQREIVGIKDLQQREGYTPIGYVYWARPGDKMRNKPTWLPGFLEWIEKAKCVKDYRP